MPEARFDWYSATIDVPPLEIAGACLDGFETASKLEMGRGRFGYASAIKVVSDKGDTLATVLAGGSNGPPNATASGERAARFVEIVRERWPAAHRVTRVDSSLDDRLDFATVSPEVLKFAEGRGLRGQSIVPLDPDDGGTVYLGSPASRVRCRVYEKGKQLRALGHDVPADDIGIVRFEVQLRPTGEGRVTAASLTAGEVWGATHWTRGLAASFLGFDPHRVPTQFRLLTTFEQRVEHCIEQYGPTLRDLRRTCGSDRAFVAVLNALLDR